MRGSLALVAALSLIALSCGGGKPGGGDSCNGESSVLVLNEGSTDLGVWVDAEPADTHYPIYPGSSVSLTLSTGTHKIYAKADGSVNTSGCAGGSFATDPVVVDLGCSGVTLACHP